MEFFKTPPKVDFMKYRTILMVVSGLMCVASVVGLFWPGPNYGTDFLGGTEIEVGFRGRVESDELRAAVEELGYRGTEVVALVGQENKYIIRVQDFSAVTPTQERRITRAIQQAVGADHVENQGIRVSSGGDTVFMNFTQPVEESLIQSTLEAQGLRVLRVVSSGQAGESIYEAQLAGIAERMIDGLNERLGERGPETPDRISRVGPRAGAQLRNAAALSLLYALGLILLYVAFRFDLRFAPGGIVALIHDALITIGAYVLLQREFSLTIVAALLTIIGFSINDTIVLYDRIRENMGRYRDKTLYEVINISTSQMLSRTLITSGTALLSISAFFIFGTPVIRDLTFALFVGFIAGVYSSIYIAAPLTELMDRTVFSKSKAKAKAARAAQRREA
jgi:preprotein translocase subunit SecF